MRLTRYFFPTLKETPSDAQIASHKLMLRAGLVCQASAGIYSWLPMGLKVLQKITQIVREEQNAIGCHEILMPILQLADIWRQSGRYDDYGQEMLRMVDRHQREMVYGPTAEEQVTEIFKKYVKSYREVPVILYQIHWKFRDEVRPRFGVMRGREFLMKDGYSFDLTPEDARQTYLNIYWSYMRTFHRMGLKVIPVKADTGPIGGDLSHEFQILAQTGESQIYYDQAFEEIDLTKSQDETQILSLYAASEERHAPKECAVAPEALKTSRAIEIGHIFNFGTKYSKPMGAFVTGKDGEPVLMEMGSYGIGVSRLVGAIIEAFHDDKGIMWPESVAPFKIGLINLKVDDEKGTRLADQLYEELMQMGVEVLYDDRPLRAGEKFHDMDLIGLPYQIIVGTKAVEEKMYERKVRQTGERDFLTKDELMHWLRG